MRWDQIETARDQYDWTALDAAVDNARAAGATDILYVLGSTPRWAARNPDLPGLYGPGSTSLPADPEDYLDFVREVAKRYEGRITAYQIWNEANTRSFYEGDWTALAQLTRRAYDAIKITDPPALVVAASSTVIPDDLFATESFFVRYARALHKARRPGGCDGRAPVPGGHHQGPGRPRGEHPRRAAGPEQGRDRPAAVGHRGQLR